MGFEPIAVIGRGCVLPGALDPDQLWRNAETGRSCLSAVSMERWRLPRQGYDRLVTDPADRIASVVGGYVQGFDEVFDPSGFALDPAEIAELDPLFHWVLYGARQALRESGQQGPLPDAGLVLGNLAYPNESASRFAEHVWLTAQEPALRTALLRGRPRPHPGNWFAAGRPAQLAARALGLGAGGFAVDAACASGLYAIKLACDRLHSGAVRLMVAGAVNRADNLFLHQGFHALSALSRSGRSRPLQRDADGLIPAEGAGLVVLMRLADALAADVPVLGVIRAVGLSNDGRGGGLLLPDRDGQTRAMRLAYALAGIDPATVSLIEAHATGTPSGDAVEVRAMAEVFADSPGVPIGSVKAQLGHPLAAAGVAGLLKVLGAMGAGVRPAVAGADRPLAELDGTPLRLPAEAEEWPGLRRAAVSAFGFGGANAHLVLDGWPEGGGSVVVGGRVGGLPEGAGSGGQGGGSLPEGGGVAASPEVDAGPLAIVALGARVGGGESAESLRRTLLTGESEPRTAAVTAVELSAEGLCFPPADLACAETRQLLVLAAAEEAVADIRLPRERTAVLIGAGSDPQAARYGARWRSAAWREGADAETVAATQQAFAAPLPAAGVTGTMPHLLAHRLNTRFDLAGPGFVVCAEEASGLVALELAARALRTHEVDAALVGAVDLADEAVQRAALAGLGVLRRPPGDAAVALVLKRLADARRDGDQVIAVLDQDGTAAPQLLVGDGPAEGEAAVPHIDPAELFGAAHAAAGLLSVAVAALALQHRVLPRPHAPALPLDAARTAEVRCSVLEGPQARTRLVADAARPWVSGPAPRLHLYSGRDRHEVAQALDADRESAAGPARLALVSTDADLAEQRERARRWLAGEGIRPPEAAYRDAPVVGETAFVFTNGSAAYPGMGRELALALPDLLDDLEASGLPRSLLTDPATATGPADALDQIMSTGLVISLHTAISRTLLGDPDAAIGYSSGETAALIALGVWTDTAEHCAESRASGLFDREIGGEYRAVRRAWERAGVPGSRWAGYLVSMPAERVRAELAGEPAVHLLALNAPGLCVVGGEAEACDAWVRRQRAHAVPISYDMAAHAPELAEVESRWWQLHHRPTTAVPGVRFYSCASGTSYLPTAERVADALTAQLLTTVDYVRVIERAWADGVRIFVEQGPRGLCTSWISRILGDRDHLAVAMDAPDGQGLARIGQVVAELAAAGVRVDADAFLGRWAAAAPRATPTGQRIAIPITPAEVRLPAERAPQAAPMPRAPRLPSTLPKAEPAPASVSTPVPPTVSVPVPVSVPASGPATRVAGVIAEARNRVTAVHRSVLAGQADAQRTFAAQQAEAQRHFLHGRSTALAALAALAHGTAHGPTAGWSPAAPAAPAGPARPRPYPGPAFDRAQLEHLAHGRISELFGPAFAAQDDRHRQTRLPRPPLLLVDRVLGIDAEPAALLRASAPGTGTLWTETDVRPDSWYLDATGRMPPGIMVEAGQADLLLISWLGADLLDRQDRVYRLLGCELTLYGSPPRPGDTLHFEIHIDGHAVHQGVRLFFFHYDCHVDGELRLTVRNGQAGFFTDEELESSAGVLWHPADGPPDPDATVDPPVATTASRFDAAQVRAFADGNPADCFGPAWTAARAHIRTPRVGCGRMLLLDEVTHYDPAGGPWGRGYLRAETRIDAADWFFDGHFHHDPCMPGTLMFEGALQAMAFSLAAGGHTLDRDGWRFEPVPGRPAALRCRRQVTPDSSRLVYEVFVTELSAGPQPTLVADVLCTVDGVQAFHAAGVALRLVPDWPLEQWRQLGPVRVQTDGTPVPLPLLGGLRGHRDDADCAVVGDVRYDYATLLAAAWGRPTEAFGQDAAVFDGGRRRARLPGPPFHFVSRIVTGDLVVGGERSGSRLVTEYDVPEDAWYFEQGGGSAMPMAVLMEVALQPCGCLAGQATDLLRGEQDLYFRNLDGTGTVLGEVTPGTRTVRTEVVLRTIARHGDLIIETFDVECHADGRPVFRLSSVFGFFPRSALESQTGLPRSQDDHRRLRAPGGRPIDLERRPPAGPMLLMLDRVTGYWPDGGQAGLGRLCAEKDIDAGDWYFKAHFFQDPVQPGSLGVEAMCRLLQVYLVESGHTGRLVAPRFEPVMTGREVTWKYRGQIVPTDGTMTVEMEILEAAGDAHECHAVAEAWLWIDGRCIYQVRGLGMRAVSTGTALSIEDTGAAGNTGTAQGPRAAATPATLPASYDTVLDPAEQAWLLDHRPDWITPAMPMMAMVDHLARTAAEHTGRQVSGLSGLRLRRWLPLGEPVRLRTDLREAPEGVTAVLSVWRQAATPDLSRFDEVIGGTVRLGPPPGPRPEPFPALADAEETVDPYTSGAMFHGPAFQCVSSLWISASGASSVLDTGRNQVPRGLLHQGVLDAALHGIPCREMGRWLPGVGADQVAVPHLLHSLEAYEPLPDDGPVRVEVRFDGVSEGDPRLPVVDIQLQVQGRVAVTLRLALALVEVPLFASVPLVQRREFLRDRRHVEGVALSTVAGEATVLRTALIDAVDIVPGTLAAVYGLPRDGSPRARTAVIAAKEHLARLLRVHPAEVEVADDLTAASVAGRPETLRRLRVREEDGVVTVRSDD
ncbi:beta-ketoacyl synthase N-terminal-like domain-containing protein [Peterkaempfera bronchialis]|uniref:beta-ketoacyl synthase N-terminal-like domain-containing protein n=1 Tax=Peterkaempfera bronchialis TaxID=2126346 RepID=UPI003C2DDF6D